MAWVKLDDQAPRNNKMLKAGPAACWLWVCGIAHSQSQLTDGFISLDVLPMIGVKGVGAVKKLAERLVVVGLFDRVEGGYQVHDYFDHNPTKVSVLEKRATDAARKRTAESSQNPTGIQADSSAPRARLPSHPIPAEKKQPSAVGRQKAPPDPRVKEFLDWFQSEYEARRSGAKYLVTWEKHGTLVKQMLGAVDLATLKIYAQIMLSEKCDDPFIVDSDRGIEVLKGKFNWLSERYAAWKKRQAS